MIKTFGIPFLLFGIVLITMPSNPQFEPIQKSNSLPIFHIENVINIIPDTEISQYDEFTYLLYDIPLSEELQKYTYDLCVQYGVSYELILSLIYAESNFQTGLISHSNDYGLMQINKSNHQRLKNELGLTDFLDAEQNIFCGIYILAGYCNKYPDTHMALMAYNMGQGGAKKLWDQGIYSTKYSRKIVSAKENLEMYGQLY